MKDKARTEEIRAQLDEKVDYAVELLNESRPAWYRDIDAQAIVLGRAVAIQLYGTFDAAAKALNLDGRSDLEEWGLLITRETWGNEIRVAKDQWEYSWYEKVKALKGTNLNPAAADWEASMLKKNTVEMPRTRTLENGAYTDAAEMDQFDAVADAAAEPTPEELDAIDTTEETPEETPKTTRRRRPTTTTTEEKENTMTEEKNTTTNGKGKWVSVAEAAEIWGAGSKGAADRAIKNGIEKGIFTLNPDAKRREVLRSEVEAYEYGKKTGRRKNTGGGKKIEEKTAPKTTTEENAVKAASDDIAATLAEMRAEMEELRAAVENKRARRRPIRKAAATIGRKFRAFKNA